MKIQQIRWEKFHLPINPTTHPPYLIPPCPFPHPHSTCGWSGHSGQQRPNCGQCWGRPHFRSVSASSTFLSSHSPHPHHYYIVQGINRMMSRMTNHCHCRQEIERRDVQANKRQEDGGPRTGPKRAATTFQELTVPSSL